VRGVGVGAWATALTEDAMKATKSNERQRLFSLRNLRYRTGRGSDRVTARVTRLLPQAVPYLCVPAVMRSVPGALAIGLCSDRLDRGAD
jgi:hypothetical protein